MMVGPGVAVAEQHGDHKYVPGKLKREVGADEDVAADCLDCGQDRIETERADQLVYGVLRFPGLRAGWQVLT